MKKKSERSRIIIIVITIILAIGIPIVSKDAISTYFFSTKAFSTLYVILFFIIYMLAYCIYNMYNYRKHLKKEEMFHDIISECCKTDNPKIFNIKADTEIEKKYSFDVNEIEMVKTILDQFRLDLLQKFFNKKILLYYYDWENFSFEECYLFLLSSFLDEHRYDIEFSGYKMLEYIETKDCKEGGHGATYQLTEFANIYYKFYYRIELLCENREKIKTLTESANIIKDILDNQVCLKRLYSNL